MASTSDLSHHLYSIPYSHYNEKARWMLDACGIAFTRHDYLPVLHMPMVRGLQAEFHTKKKKDSVSSPFSTPALAVYADGKPKTLLPDSSLIGRYAVAHRKPGLHNLYDPNGTASSSGGTPDGEPAVAAEVAELEKRFHDNVGPYARLFAYYYLLPGPKWLLSGLCLNAQIIARNLPLWQVVIAYTFFPLLMFVIVYNFGVTHQRMLRARTKLLAECDFVESRLASGQRYLCGDRLSAADITFASLLSVAVGVRHTDGYGAWMPAVETLPQEYQEFVLALQRRPAGQFVMRMYHDHRNRSV